MRLHSALFRTGLARAAGLALAVLLSACGGGGGGGSGSGPATESVAAPFVAGDNVVQVTVDQGIDGSAVNSPFVTVTVCQPGTQVCQVVDHVLVDTGSYGLRLRASALQGFALPAVNAPGGAPLAECAQFASGYTWGAIRAADVRIGSKEAAALPVQVINDAGPAYATVPTSCRNTGAPLAAGGAKGLIGVGFLTRDCGSPCVNGTSPNVYFSCPPTGCVSTVAPLASQVANPVPFFATDNNGVVIDLPAVPLGGVGVVTGSLRFGVDTQDNNRPGSLPVYQADADGDLQTTYRGRTVRAFIDSGSNGIFFRDAAIPRCSSGFFCPPAPLSLSATVTGSNGTASSTVPFQVENADRVAGYGTAAAHLGGDIGFDFFDWGLPFFYGRTVYVVFQGATTSRGTGPYWSF